MGNSLLLFLLLFSSILSAQLSISNGKHIIEISGTVSTYYNHRVLKEGEVEKDKNRFNLRDAQLMLEGRNSNLYEYRIQMDFADLTQGSTDPENPGLMDAWFKYKGFKWLDIQLGYGKIQYSRSSVVPFTYSTFWQRAELFRGQFFSRRDIGLTLSKSFWQRRVELTAGAYTGLGEVSARVGDNDASGALEYVGRAEFCWPSYYRNRDIDVNHSPVPMIALGVNGRYTNRVLPAGAFFPSGAVGDFGLKVLSGKKETYGFDISAQWKGFSAQFELHQIKGMPADTNSFLLRNYTVAQSNGYFLSGGYYGQLSYFSRKLKTAISLRYESFNISDLVAGDNERLAVALAYQLDGFNSMIKAQWTHIMKEEILDITSWREQFRIGWQVMF
jgi:hypothetical protein